MQDHELKVAANGAESVPYNMPEYPVYAGGAWLHIFKGMGVINHWHWDLEFAYVLNGKVDYTVNQDTFTVHAGEGIFINSGQIHRNFSADGRDGEYRCVLFHPSVLQSPFSTAEQLQRELCRDSMTPYLILRPDIPWQKELLNDINSLYEYITADIQHNIFGILSHVYHAVHMLLDNMPSSRTAPSDMHELNTMREMMGYVQTHYGEKMRVSDISKAGKVGTSTCHALFRKYLNTSPMKYLADYRLEKASGLLKNTGTPVSEIAEMTGFASQSYFAECFKAMYSVSPSEYRQCCTE